MGKKRHLRRALACSVAACVGGISLLATAPAGASRYSGWNGYVLDHVDTREKVFFITVDARSITRETVSAADKCESFYGQFTFEI